jgi:peptidoglycan/xylan/chitin deacetylase (PgdA/CDA1 family)
MVFLFTYSGITFLYRKLQERQGPLVRVVAFHDVDNEAWFEHVISSLTKDFNIVSPHEYEEGIFNLGKVNMLITFDDGYESWVTTCLPILRKYGVKALFFVNSGLLSSAHDEAEVDSFVRENLRLSPKKTLSYEGARTLLDEGHTLGGHTTHHTSLRGASADILSLEVEADKHVTESRLGVVLKHFAYPFGTARDYSYEVESHVRGYGYEFVYIAEPGFVQRGERHIPRTLIEKDQSYASIRRWMHGGYDLFSYLKAHFTR